MNKLLSILPFLALLSGCATAGIWNHPTKNEEQFTADKYECLKDGEQYAANLGFNGNPLIVNDRARQCMAVKGYTWTKAPKQPT